ncbi:MAG: pantetheine-phosphate adenylyltransferase [Rhodothermales bacterium]
MAYSHRLALYPGTFDPVTLGHLDILERARQVFDEVEVTVAVNASKNTLFSVEERCEMIRLSSAHLTGIHIEPFEGLLVDRARERGAVALVRGLRQVSDFDYEFRMAFANRKLLPEVETVFFMTSEAHAFTSSSIVRDVHRWGGEIKHFVPRAVLEMLQAKFPEVRGE